MFPGKILLVSFAMLSVLTVNCKQDEKSIPASVAANKTAADKASADKASTDKASADKASADKASADNAIAGKGLAVNKYLGTWVSPCIQGDDSNPNNTRATFVFTEKSLVASIDSFAIADTRCTKSLRTSSQNANYILGKDVSGLTGTQEIDLKNNFVTQTIHDADEVSYYNSDARCGFSNWILDETKFVSNSECAGDGQVFTIIKIENNMLTLGRQTELLDGSSAAKRPTSLDSIVLSKE